MSADASLKNRLFVLSNKSNLQELTFVSEMRHWTVVRGAQLDSEVYLLLITV